MAENTIFGGATGLLQAGSGRRATLRDILLQEATSTAPVRHWLQGANRVAQGLLGGALDREARERAAADSQALLGAMGGGTSSTPTVTTPSRQDTLTGSDGSIGQVAPAQTNGTTASDVAFFNSRGWSPVQSAALASTIVNESSGNTAARNRGDGRDGSDSIGTMQWNGPRAVALQQFAAQRGQDWRNRQTQLEFVDAELRGQVAGSNESRWGNMLARANDPLSAARAAISYVRPAGWSAANPDAGHNFGRRLATTRSIFGQYGGALAPVTPGPQAAMAPPADTLEGGDGSLSQTVPNVLPAGGPDLNAAQMPNVIPPGASRTDPMATAPPVSGLDTFRQSMRIAPQYVFSARPRDSVGAIASASGGGSTGGVAGATAEVPTSPDAEDAAWAERQRLAAVEDERQRGMPWPASSAPTNTPLPAARPATLDAMQTAGEGDAMAMAQANPTAMTGAPTGAPVPMARPQMPVPVPMARPAAPNALPPGAVTAGPAPGPRLDISRALGISDRDRLMMLRDEGSLAPGEADRLRGAPVEMMGRTQAAAPAAPGAGGFLAPVNSVRDRLYEMLTGRSAPAAAPASQPQQMAQANGGAPAGMDARRATLMRIAISEDAPPQVRAMAMQQLQQMQPDTQVITTPDGAIVAIDKRTNRMQTIREAARPPTIVGEGQRLVDPQTGRLIAEGGQQRTTQQRDYAAYVQDETAAGRTPKSLGEWDVWRRREGSGLETAEEAARKELGKGLAQQFNAMAEDGVTAQNDARNLQQVQALIGQIGTGPAAEIQKRLADLGIQVGPNVDKIQALQALLNRLTPAQRLPGSGATSDFDARMFRDSLPRLINSEGGNALILGAMNDLIANRIQRAEIAMRVQMGPTNGGLTAAQGVAEIRKLGEQAREISNRVAAAANPTSAGGAAAPGARQSASPPVPQVGAVEGGFRFKGGDPSSPSNWERVQ